ncbi:MAG TPA: helix-hairpin-helix domain-containing protein [Thermodesulfobacteriota bacterium]
MRLNLNTATLDDLSGIEGLTVEKARQLLNHRDRLGEFRTWDDVRAVPGFSQNQVEQLKRGGAGLNVS